MTNRELFSVPPPSIAEDGSLTEIGEIIIRFGASGDNPVQRHERAAWDRFIHELRAAQLAGDTVTIDPGQLIEMIEVLVSDSLEREDKKVSAIESKLNEVVQARSDLRAILVDIRDAVEQELEDDAESNDETKDNVK